MAKIFNVHSLRKQLCYAGRVWCTPGLSERICYGIDMDCKNVDVAVQRWEKVSGKVAKRKRREKSPIDNYTGGQRKERSAVILVALATSGAAAEV